MHGERGKSLPFPSTTETDYTEDCSGIKMVRKKMPENFREIGTKSTTLQRCDVARDRSDLRHVATAWILTRLKKDDDPGNL